MLFLINRKFRSSEQAANDEEFVSFRQVRSFKGLVGCVFKVKFLILCELKKKQRDLQY